MDGLGKRLSPQRWQDLYKLSVSILLLLLTISCTPAGLANRVGELEQSHKEFTELMEATEMQWIKAAVEAREEASEEQVEEMSKLSRCIVERLLPATESRLAKLHFEKYILYDLWSGRSAFYDLRISTVERAAMYLCSIQLAQPVPQFNTTIPPEDKNE